MILNSTGKIQIVLGGAVAATELPFLVAYVDIDTTSFTPNPAHGVTNGATAVDMLGSPSGTVRRNLKALNVYNEDSAIAVVTIRLNDGGTIRKLAKVSLDPGDTLEWTDATGWQVLSASGQRKMVIGTTGAVPLGAIIMWSGSIATIPDDYHLCDGTGGTVDLRDKFVVGATSDDVGVAKTNLQGSLQQTGGTTAHLHSAHANLTHTGLTIGNHTGLTHSLAIANHPDLTHVAIADHSVASQAVSMPGLTHADHSQASQAVSNASGVGSFVSAVGTATSVVGTATTASLSLAGTLTLSISSTGTARSIVTATAAPSAASHTVNVPSNTVSVPSGTVTIPAMTGTFPANTLTHASHPTHTGSSPAFTLTHPAVGTHVGTNYGVHTITQPADHGAAGTVTHSYSQPNDHVISAHDTVANVIPFYALAFIQRVA